MFSTFKEWLIKFITSRFFLLFILTAVLCGILLYRLFDLQIVRGESYMDNFTLSIRKERTIASTRGNIYDCNGNVLAYNELAYSVLIEDVYESGNTKNQELNATVRELIRIIESNGDTLINDFPIVLDEDDRFSFTYSGTKLLRFLADVYGHARIEDLLYAEKTASPEDVVSYLCGRNRFGIGGYMTDEEGAYVLDESGNRQFLPGNGYSHKELLKMINIRYAMSLNSYQKYIPTVVAADVCDKTIAAVMESSDILAGVSVSEGTVRKYVDALYFSNIVGYIGKISSEELTRYNTDAVVYSNNDMIGKIGIELSMEEELRGSKGKETVYVDNRGRVIETAGRINPTAGNDIYLTVDKNLQKAAYHILEQKIAGILVEKIRNIKEYVPGPNASASQIKIPIYDVYVALFENNILRMKDFNHEDATDTEKTVYASYIDNKETVLANLREELMEKGTIYKKLSKEYAVYESFIVTLLMSDNCGILRSELIDTSDETYKAWRNKETISLKDYLQYAISMNWIDTTKLVLENEYADSGEIYLQLVDYILDALNDNTEFGKKMIKYMIMNNQITGRQICYLLVDRKVVVISSQEQEELDRKRITAYDFMLRRIKNLDITPAQLALDPCTGDMVITDVHTGDVLAMVSYPGYDTNRVSDSAYWNRINTDLSYPMLNYATQRRTAPGSTYKMVVAAAALEEGYITTRERIQCKGYFDKMESYNPPRCWVFPGMHGSLNAAGAIKNSCNCFFYEVGYRMSTKSGSYKAEDGIEVMTEYARLFGLGDKSGVELEELSPRISDEFPVVSAIGQGDANYTTSQLARYVTTIANSGTCYNLTVIDRILAPGGDTVLENHAQIRNVLEFSDTTWSTIHSGMRQVIETKEYYDDLGVKVAGKTGTAQETRSRPNHAVFVCYAPYEAPEIAIATRIEYGYTSEYAAETTKDVIRYYFNLASVEELITGFADDIQAYERITD